MGVQVAGDSFPMLWMDTLVLSAQKPTSPPPYGQTILTRLPKVGSLKWWGRPGNLNQHANAVNIF